MYDRRTLYYNGGRKIRQVATLAAAGEKVEGEYRDGVWVGWIPMALGALVGLDLLQGRDRFESGCNARNIQDFYKIVEKPIGAGGFGVVSNLGKLLQLQFCCEGYSWFFQGFFPPGSE